MEYETKVLTGKQIVLMSECLYFFGDGFKFMKLKKCLYFSWFFFVFVTLLGKFKAVLTKFDKIKLNLHLNLNIS